MASMRFSRDTISEIASVLDEQKHCMLEGTYIEACNALKFLFEHSKTMSSSTPQSTPQQNTSVSTNIPDRIYPNHNTCYHTLKCQLFDVIVNNYWETIDNFIKDVGPENVDWNELIMECVEYRGDELNILEFFVRWNDYIDAREVFKEDVLSIIEGSTRNREHFTFCILDDYLIEDEEKRLQMISEYYEYLDYTMLAERGY